jgi:hypothetical protein
MYQRLKSVLEGIERSEMRDFMYAQMPMRGNDMAVLRRYMHEVTNNPEREKAEYLARHCWYSSL